MEDERRGSSGLKRHGEHRRGMETIGDEGKASKTNGEHRRRMESIEDEWMRSSGLKAIEVGWRGWTLIGHDLMGLDDDEDRTVTVPGTNRSRQSECHNL
jgi:hypothetical protein